MDDNLQSALDSFIKTARAVVPLSPSATPTKVAARKKQYGIVQSELKEVGKVLKKAQANEAYKEVSATEMRYDRLMSRVNALRADPALEYAVYLLKPGGGHYYARRATDLAEFLSSRETGPAQTREDAALVRLYHCYWDTPANWIAAMRPLRAEQAAGGLSPNEDDARDGEDVHQAMFRMHKACLFSSRQCTGTGKKKKAFILGTHIVRMMETLLLVREWESPSLSKGSKTAYVNLAFEHEQPEHDAAITALTHDPVALKASGRAEGGRLEQIPENSRCAYARPAQYGDDYQFGPGIFLDPIWDTLDPETGKARTRSATFYQDWGMVEMGMMSYSGNCDSLFRVLTQLGLRDVAEAAEKFMTDHPPNIVPEIDFPWGEDPVMANALPEIEREESSK
ncbi:hypothetical protein C8J57DRAFT_1225042 [Mycena rebaudengoi]|nr:hypothetical protein C8J57DRAFT_1225042 [Mycena rebaudengoi]